MKRLRYHSIIAISLIITAAVCCQKELSDLSNREFSTIVCDSVTTVISLKADDKTKATADESITNVLLLLFSEKDTLLSSYYTENNESITIKTKSGYFTILAVANAGNITPEAQTSLSDFKQIEYQGITEDGNRMIYSGEFKGNLNSSQNEISIQLKSIMAKISVSFDHSKLDSDVSIEIVHISLKNVPVYSSLFPPNRAVMAQQIAETGDYSETISTPLYMPENLQGNTLNEYCSFLEIKALYSSSTKQGEVIYRSHFGEVNSFNIVRGVHYHNRISFSGRGIGENAWRTDTGGLTDIEHPFIFIEAIYLYPYSLYFSSIGEVSYISATIIPIEASFPQIVWVSENPGVAYVDYDGSVTATGAGETVIMAVGDDASEVVSNYVTVVVNPHIYVNSIEVTLDNNTLYGAGAVTTATASVYPVNATNQEVIWSSSDPSVASVSPDGAVYAHNSGSCSIIASSAENSSITSEASLEVIIEIPVEGISLSPQEVVFEVGSVAGLSAEITPANATNKTIIWSSDNSSVAAVSPEGTLYAISPGSCTITAASADNSAVSGMATVTVIAQYTPVSGVILNTSYASLTTGESLSLEATLLPANASEREIIWFSSNPAAASVCPLSGTVYGEAPGTTTITAVTTCGGHSAECTVDVFQPLGIDIGTYELFSYNTVNHSITGAEIIIYARLGIDSPSDMNIVHTVMPHISIEISYSYTVKGSLVSNTATIGLDGSNNNDNPSSFVGGSDATISLIFPLTEEEIMESIGSLTINVHPGSTYAGFYYVSW